MIEVVEVLYPLAGGCAGAASRTVVSPLERLKIIQCVNRVGGFIGLTGLLMQASATARFWFAVQGRLEESDANVA